MPVARPEVFVAPPEVAISPSTSLGEPGTASTSAWTAVPVLYPEKLAPGKAAPWADAGPGVNAAIMPAAVSTATPSAATRALTRVLLLLIGPPEYGDHRLRPTSTYG